MYSNWLVTLQVQLTEFVFHQFWKLIVIVNEEVYNHVGQTSTGTNWFGEEQGSKPAKQYGCLPRHFSKMNKNIVLQVMWRHKKAQFVNFGSVENNVEKAFSLLPNDFISIIPQNCWNRRFLLQNWKYWYHQKHPWYLIPLDLHLLKYPKDIINHCLSCQRRSL